MDPTGSKTPLTQPVLFIIGSTASGKTKLSLELARTYKDIEIINADALQLYSSADIMTAKATEAERKEIPHHMLDILQLDSMDFTRKEYFEMASKVIDDVRQRNKIPLIVGGTNYYIESLVYSDFDNNMKDMKEEKEEKDDDESESPEKEIGKQPLGKKSMNQIGSDDEGVSQAVPNDWESLSPRSKHSLLASFDPLMARKIHQNDHKRVDNYIKVYLEEGIQPSKKIMKLEQARKLRYPNTFAFWPKDQVKSNLNDRIYKRINEMIDMNGVNEIIRVYQELEKHRVEFDFTRGVLQSIGYKEFYEFWRLVKAKAQRQGLKEPLELLKGINDVKNLNFQLKECLQKCKEKLAMATEKYAVKQVRWIKNRFATDAKLKNHFFLLEFSDASKFNEQVVGKAVDVMKNYYDGRLSFPVFESPERENQIRSKDHERKFLRCEDCEMSFSSIESLKNHLDSRRHLKTSDKNFKRERHVDMRNEKEDIEDYVAHRDRQDPKSQKFDLRNLLERPSGYSKKRRMPI